jgi:hypothetical protein
MHRLIRWHHQDILPVHWSAWTQLNIVSRTKLSTPVMLAVETLPLVRLALTLTRSNDRTAFFLWLLDLDHSFGFRRLRFDAFLTNHGRSSFLGFNGPRAMLAIRGRGDVNCVEISGGDVDRIMDGVVVVNVVVDRRNNDLRGSYLLATSLATRLATGSFTRRARLDGSHGGTSKFGASRRRSRNGSGNGNRIWPENDQSLTLSISVELVLRWTTGRFSNCTFTNVIVKIVAIGTAETYVLNVNASVTL